MYLCVFQSFNMFYWFSEPFCFCFITQVVCNLSMYCLIWFETILFLFFRLQFLVDCFRSFRLVIIFTRFKDVHSYTSISTQTHCDQMIRIVIWEFAFRWDSLWARFLLLFSFSNWIHINSSTFFNATKCTILHFCILFQHSHPVRRLKVLLQCEFLTVIVCFHGPNSKIIIY